MDGAPRLGGRWLGPAEEEPAGTTPPHPAFPGVTGTFCPMPALSQRELWLFAQGVTALQCDLGGGVLHPDSMAFQKLGEVRRSSGVG